MTDRLIAIDIGNSRTELGLFEAGSLLKSDFLPTAPEYTQKLCGFAKAWNDETAVERIVIASVVPAISDLLGTELETLFDKKPVMVNEFKTTLLPLKVDYPETVGVDRVVNGYAAIHLYGAPAVIVSLGTATTFEVISSEGEYIGGAIAPGVKISLEALTQRTALLPPAVWSKPSRINAVNTLDQMKSGIYYGTVSMIEGMVKRIKSDLNLPAKVIGTGGISGVIAAEGVFDVHDPMLTLKGLDLVARKMTDANL